MDQIEVPESDVLPIDAVAAGVSGLSVVFTNVFGIAAESGWVLVDAALYGSAPRITRWARDHFGDIPPSAIVLTHGHFDHVGALKSLLAEWPQTMVYAHEEELPYITGERSYPPPDPTVGGGAMARMAALYPRGPIDVRDRAAALPANGGVPGLPEWRWIHTPGHTAGHVSLFREADRALIVGDAFCTTNAQSFFAAAITQKPEVSGPPAYFTTEWDLARESVRKLAALNPEFIAPGHGRPLEGEASLQALIDLSLRFDELARPEHGRYVENPRTK